MAFKTLDAIAAPLPLANIDTDKILAGAFLKTISRAGLGAALFSGMRYDDDGRENPEFVLNRAPYRDAGILIAGDNFGCGSSREHAPWALMDFGIRCIIAPSFADIFYNNCFKNGILPITLDPGIIQDLIQLVTSPSRARLSIDLVAQTVTTVSGERISFSVDPDRRSALLEGRDEIGQSLLELHAIQEWERKNLWRFGRDILRDDVSP